MDSQSFVVVALLLASCARAHSESNAPRVQPTYALIGPGNSRAPVSDSLAPASARAARTKWFRLPLGVVELRGTLRLLDAHTAELDVALEVRSAKRAMRVTYEYVRLRVELEGDAELELGVHDRRMYALVPRGSRTWNDVAASDGDLSSKLELVRLDGAGEER